MKKAYRTRDLLVLVLLAGMAAACAFATWQAWGAWQGYSAVKGALAERGATSETVETLQAKTADLDQQRSLLAPQVEKGAAELAELQKSLMPLETGASRQLRLDVLDLAARCGLQVEEVKPVGGEGRWPDLAGQTPAAPAANADDVKSIAFLGQFPAGDVYRRPLLRLQCRAGYAATRKFLDQLGGLRWRVTPVAFRLEQADAPHTGEPTEDESAVGATAVPGAGASQESTLRLTLVLAL
jgi:hypothetical protein